MNGKRNEKQKKEVKSAMISLFSEEIMLCLKHEQQNFDQARKHFWKQEQVQLHEADATDFFLQTEECSQHLSATLMSNNKTFTFLFLWTL